MKFNINEFWSYLYKLQSPLILFISNGRAKTMLAILQFLYCRVYENLDCNFNRVSFFAAGDGRGGKGAEIAKMCEVCLLLFGCYCHSNCSHYFPL